jgi:hypothetical protein
MPRTILAAYINNAEMIADIQRQQLIVDDARRALAADGKTAPASGSEGFAAWHRSVLKDAGETYSIEWGQKVAL